MSVVLRARLALVLQPQALPAFFRDFSLDATSPRARERTFFLRATADNRCRCARNAKECRDGGAGLQRRAGSARRLPAGLPADPYVPN
jgi:hypothetical protein